MSPTAVFFLACLAGLLVYAVLVVVGLKLYAPIGELRNLGMILGLFGTQILLNQWAVSRAQDRSSGGEEIPVDGLMRDESEFPGGSNIARVDAFNMPRVIVGSLIIGLIAACLFAALETIWGYGFILLIGVGLQAVEVHSRAIKAASRFSVRYEPQDPRDVVKHFFRIIRSKETAFPIMTVAITSALMLTIWFLVGMVLQVPSQSDLVDRVFEGEVGVLFPLEFFVTILVIFFGFWSGQFLGAQFFLRIALVVQSRRRRMA
jgi:hypothetical protein